MNITLLSAVAALVAFSARSQGTFLYDQQSSINDAVPGQGVGWASLQDFQSGQSFTPALTTIDFVQFMFNDVNPNDAAGATVHIALRSGSITGNLLGTTASVSMPNGFAGPGTFLFPGRIQLTSGDTYYFSVVAETAAPFQIFGSTSFNYPGGTAFGGIVPSVGADFWFREGIIVPEPTSATLLLLGSLLLALRRPAK